VTLSDIFGLHGAEGDFRLKLGAPRDRTATESKNVAGTGANGETV
jgi:hypothetical protein